MAQTPANSQLRVRDLQTFTHDTVVAVVVVACLVWIASVLGLMVNIQVLMDGIYGHRSVVYMGIAIIWLVASVGSIALLIYGTPGVLGGYLHRYVVDQIRRERPPLGEYWGVQMQCCPGLPGWLRGRTINDDIGMLQATRSGLLMEGDSLTLELAFDDILEVRVEPYILGLMGTRTILETRGPCGQRSICLWDCSGLTIRQARQRNAALHASVLATLAAHHQEGLAALPFGPSATARVRA